MQPAGVTGEKSKRPAVVNYLLRLLGFLVGALCIGLGSLAVIENRPYRPWHILVLLNFLGMGLLFCWYGVRGGTRPPIPSGRVGLFLMWGLGVLVVAIGAYTLLLDDAADTLGKIVVACVGVAGVWLIALGVINRKRLLMSKRER